MELFANVSVLILAGAMTDARAHFVGAVKARVVTEPFENVNKIIDELRAYEVSGRKVLQISELGY